MHPKDRYLQEYLQAGTRLAHVAYSRREKGRLSSCVVEIKAVVQIDVHIFRYSKLRQKKSKTDHRTIRAMYE